MAVLTTKPLYSKIFDEARVKGYKFGTKEARDWYRQKAMNVTRKNMNVNRLLERNESRQKTTVEPGKMYYFLYDAKTKDTLPYWDRFPLIFPIEFYSDGFLGINLHYLPPMFRARLMDALHTTRNNKRYDESTKLKISYEILKSASKFKYFKPCVKRYLSSHVQSNFLLVDSYEWDLALMLPTERFQKKDRSVVWEDSMAFIAK